MDIVDKIIQCETGQLDAIGTVELIAELIQTGLIDELQGCYGRTASRLIHMEIISSDGTINHQRLDEVLEGESC